VRLKRIWLPKPLAQNLVIVDLAVDRKSNRFVFTQHRLSASVNADDGKTFMHQYGTVGCVVSTPVWAAVANLPTHPDCGGLEFLHIWVTVMWLATLSVSPRRPETYQWQANMPHIVLVFGEGDFAVYTLVELLVRMLGYASSISFRLRTLMPLKVLFRLWKCAFTCGDLIFPRT
jgi:hypothetical protein